MHRGYVVTFDGGDSWSFGNEFAKNVVIFGVDNNSSSHAYNCKNRFLAIREGLTYGINGNFRSPDKNFCKFSKANTKFCLSLYYNSDKSYLFVNGKEIFKLKVDKKNVNFPTEYCFRSTSNGLSAIKFQEVSLNGSVNDFSVDCNSIDKFEMLNVHKC